MDGDGLRLDVFAPSTIAQHKARHVLAGVELVACKSACVVLQSVFACDERAHIDKLRQLHWVIHLGLPVDGCRIFARPERDRL